MACSLITPQSVHQATTDLISRRCEDYSTHLLCSSEAYDGRADAAEIAEDATYIRISQQFL